MGRPLCLDNEGDAMKRVTRAKAIRLKCLDCCCGSPGEVRNCTATKCPLFPYRMGKEDKGIYEDGVDTELSETPANCEDFEDTDEAEEE